MQKAKFVISKSKVIAQYEIVRKICDKVSYSCKTNQYVTKVLENGTNSMFSVHLESELKHIKDYSRVIFLAQGWDLIFIKKIIDKGIKYFVIDNETDLEKMLEFLDNCEININLFLRLKLKENTIKTERYFVFGMKSKILATRIIKLKDHPKIDKLGIHFHRKTQNMSEWSLVSELENLFDKQIFEAIDMINIGGGIPAEYANTNTMVLPGIINKINEFRKWTSKYNIELYVEPGRFIAGPSGKLITKVINMDEKNIIVNASVYNSDMDAILVPVKLLIEGEKENGEAYVIKGITPCSLDLFRYKVYLNNPKIGDDLIFLNAGAYNFASDFCDLDPLETEIVK